MNMKLNKIQVEDALRGATLFGSGGGGTFDLSKKLLNRADFDNLNLLTSIEKNKYYGTVFGIGSLDTIKDIDFSDLGRRALEKYKELTGQLFDVMVFGEQGPLIFAINFVCASKMKMALLDFDAGGGRAIPNMVSDVYTPLNLKRLPLVVLSERGNSIKIDNVPAEKIDPIVDEFYEKEKSTLTLVGYVNKGSEMADVELGTLSKAIDVGKSLRENKKIPFFEFIEKVTVKKIEKITDRFTRVKVTTEEGYTIHAVNEFLVVEKNSKPVVTAPTIISLLDENSGLGSLSSELEIGKKYTLLKAKPVKAMYKKSFYEKHLSPKAFGINMETKIW